MIIGTVNIWFSDVPAFLGKHTEAKKDLTAGMDQITKAPCRRAGGPGAHIPGR